MDPGLRRGDELVERWAKMRALRSLVTRAVEPKRQDKTIGSSLEASVSIFHGTDFYFDGSELAELVEACIVADVDLVSQPTGDSVTDKLSANFATVTRTTDHKCGRCWRHLPEVTADNALCSRCDHVVGAMEAAS